MKVSILIPFYNDATVIEATARRLAAAVAELPYEAEILFCDDGSTDGGGEKITALGLSCCRVLTGAHLGKGGTLRRGVLAATGELIFYTDADLAYGTAVLLPFLQTAEATGGIVVGKRTGKGGYGAYSAARRVFSGLYRRLVRRIAALPVSDPQSGCKAYPREMAVALFTPLRENGYSFEFETLLRAEQLGFPITELPVRVLVSANSHVHPLRDGLRMMKEARRISKTAKSGNRES